MNWKRSQHTAPKRKTQQKKLSGRSQNLQPPCCWNQGSGSSSMPSSPAHLTRARGSAFCVRPLKEDWIAVLKTCALATGSACNWSVRMWNADISTLRKWREERRLGDFHSLRKTFGTNLHHKGVVPRVAMELMRDSDMRLLATFAGCFRCRAATILVLRRRCALPLAGQQFQPIPLPSLTRMLFQNQLHQQAEFPP